MKNHDEQHVIDQLAYLLDELDAVEPLISRLPDDLLEARPRPNDRSVKELYGILVEVGKPETLDQERPQFSEAVDPQSIAIQRDWNALSIGAILDELRSQRARLVEDLEQRRGNFSAVENARWIITADLACQRQVGERLFDIQPGNRE